MMDGEISLESEPDKGSRFSFAIVLKDGTKQAEEEAVPGELDALQGRRILVVEDNELNAEIAGSILNLHGIEAERAVNGLLGVKAFSEKEPGYYDAILMDIRMPVMDGLDMKKSIESGMNGHLAKPIDFKELMQTLLRVIGSRN